MFSNNDKSTHITGIYLHNFCMRAKIIIAELRFETNTNTIQINCIKRNEKKKNEWNKMKKMVNIIIIIVLYYHTRHTHILIMDIEKNKN